MPDERADECPFPKPFPEDFGDCPTYQPRLVFPSDASGRTLKPIWTCAHLEVGRRSIGGWFASCGLGDAAGRAAWLEERGALGAAMAALRTDCAAWGAPLLRRLVAARAAGPLAMPSEVAAIRELMLSNFDLALGRHAARLAAVAADPAELRDAFGQVIDSFLRAPTAELLAPAALVVGFGPAARLLFKPESEANLRPA